VFPSLDEASLGGIDADGQTGADASYNYQIDLRQDVETSMDEVARAPFVRTY
jgi:hypothetical protein